MSTNRTRCSGVERAAHASLMLLIAAAAGCSACQEEPARPDIHHTPSPTPVERAAPDVYLVVIDTLRPDHLDAYGYDLPTAPFLRSLAERSAVFDDAVSTSSWTAPAVASIMTGLYPMRHGVTQGFHAHHTQMSERVAEGRAPMRLNALRANHATLAETLAEDGYTTFGIATNINVGPETGISRGLGRFEPIDLRREHRPSEEGLWYGTAEDVLGVFESWRDEIAQSAPAFVYLHLTDPHEPYRMRGRALEENGSDEAMSAYDTEIRYVDSVLERVLATVDDDAVVVVVSDHGEAFGEHGYRRHPVALHREVNRVLLMISGPGVRPGRHASRVSLVDVYPTIAELAGIDAGEGLDGLSLAPLLRGGREAEPLLAELGQRYVFAHRRIDEQHALFAVMHGSWKLISGPETSELYDVSTDPLEQSDLAESAPGAMATLTARIDALRAEQVGAPEGTSEIAMSEDELEMLRRLGYIE